MEKMYIEKYNKYLVNSYSANEIVFVSGKGSYLYDINKKKYLDFTSGIGVNSLGHCNEKLVNAITEQSKKLIHLSNLYLNENTINLAEKLINFTGFKKVFFSNSGAESNEGGIKIARKYSYDKYGAGRSDIITLKNSFHGRTLTTLSATGQDKFHNYFYPFTQGFIYSKANDISDFKAKLNNNVCAVMLEGIQGEGGIISLQNSYVQELYRICNEKDIVVIFDEVQTGIGRTGKFFCFEHYNIKPDIVTLAKGLGGGVPIGAILCGEKTKNTISYGDHGSTFGGNPLVTAVANVVLDEFLSTDLLNNINYNSEILFNELNKIQSDEVISIKGKGLMIGIEVKRPTKYYIDKAMEKGLLILSAGNNTLRLLPPLNIQTKDIKLAIAILTEIFKI